MLIIIYIYHGFHDTYFTFSIVVARRISRAYNKLLLDLFYIYCPASPFALSQIVCSRRYR